MEKLELGDITVRVDGSTVVFSSSADSRIQLEVSSENLEQIIGYVASLGQSPNEERLGFRVPVNRLDLAIRDRLKVSIETGGEQIELTLIDLSLTGMLVEHGGRVDLQVGSQVLASLRNGKQLVTIGANVVRHVDDRLLALHFPTSIRDGELDPPDALVGFFRVLEIAWLKQRL